MFPGSQLLNPLQDLGYQVRVLSDPDGLPALADQERPLLILAHVEPRPAQVCEAIARLKTNPATGHIPVIALAAAENLEAQEAARQAGATLVVNEQAILVHLKQLLDQALQVD